MTAQDPHEAARRRPAFAKDEAVEALLETMNRALANISIPLPASRADPATLPLVYVVGAPRSGTTLMHQLIARHLPLGYVDNTIARFWLRPAIGIAMSRALLGEPGSRSFDLDSRHGVTEGPAGPHEFGYFWRHWLQLDEAPTHHLDEAAQNRIDQRGLAAALEEIRAAFGRPVVFKNVICGFHARLLTRVHPLSLFVHVTRDTQAVARSILKTRRERYGSYATWWSLKPSTYPFSEDDPAAQALRQAIDCQREIEEELSPGEVHVVSLDYVKLCADPRAALVRVRDGLVALGSRHELSGEIPSQLSASPGSTLPARLEAELQRQILSGK